MDVFVLLAFHRHYPSPIFYLRWHHFVIFSNRHTNRFTVGKITEKLAKSRKNQNNLLKIEK
jgi:hypothetical protein